jgi:hypothetical protein
MKGARDIMTDEAGNELFAVAQQLFFGYEVHAFKDKDHFLAWAKAHPTRRLIPLSLARGRIISRSPIDHRFDEAHQGGKE